MRRNLPILKDIMFLDAIIVVSEEQPPGKSLRSNFVVNCATSQLASQFKIPAG